VIQMCWLPDKFGISRRVRNKIEEDYEHYLEGLPNDLPGFVIDRYGFDISGSYSSRRTKIVFGKASGQLSMTEEQVRRDGEDGLGFVVLKTVIAQDSRGKRTMEEWAVPYSRMVAEKIRGKSGKLGWTITWKGRGWPGTLEQYLDLMQKTLKISRKSNMLIVPSCIFHLPDADEKWKIEEYQYTLEKFLEVWRQTNPQTPIILEKSFSPTLAGSERADKKETIIYWLANITKIIKSRIGKIELGIKVMNAGFEDEFQVEMLKTLSVAKPSPDFIVYGNRLFDPDRTFDGVRGVAYGGPDLSTRNLRVLSSVCRLQYLNQFPDLPPISATGDIHSGRMALEYILRGATSCQMHTLFQLPVSEYPMCFGTRTVRALHGLIFSPADGLIAGMQYCKERWGSLLDSEKLSITQISALHKKEEFSKEVLDVIKEN